MKNDLTEKEILRGWLALTIAYLKDKLKELTLEMKRLENERSEDDSYRKNSKKRKLLLKEIANSLGKSKLKR